MRVLHPRARLGHANRGSRHAWTGLVIGAAVLLSACQTISTGGGTVSTTTSGGTSGTTATTTAVTSVPPVASTTYPVHIAPGGRYLVDASGKPFLMQGEAAWSLLAQLTKEDAVRYLDDRKARGFNTILVNLIERNFSSNAPNNAYGQPPFTTPDDFSTPNEQYFRHVDYVLQEAAKRGFLVLLVPAYLGHSGIEGWYDEMVANGTAKLQGYGRYVGTRYGGMSNIIWVEGGDLDPARKDVVDAVATGISQTDPDALHTAHTGPMNTALNEWSGYPWLDLNNVYTYEDVYASSISSYRQSTMPMFMMESTYENEYDVTTDRLRAQAYGSVLAGSTGQIFGNNPIWSFGGPGIFSTNTTWQAQLGSAGSRSMTLLGQLFGSIEWWKLQPDPDGRFLTNRPADGRTDPVAALSSDGKVGIVYAPRSTSFTIDLAKMAGPTVTLTWRDPSSGAERAAAPQALANSGTRTLTTPGTNAEGYGDWVLIARS